MTIVGVRAGRAQFRESPEGKWRSAIEKLPVHGPVRVHSEGLIGDEQADRRYHGGPDKAVLAYCRDHYALWRNELGRADFGPGVLGENLEIEGGSEASVCIGDTYETNGVRFQVSQPRQPCWKPARLHGIPELTSMMAKLSRTGWYLRVLEEGVVDCPSEMKLVARPHPEWSIERANRLLYHKAEGNAARLELASLPELSLAWQEMLSGRE